MTEFDEMMHRQSCLDPTMCHFPMDLEDICIDKILHRCTETQDDSEKNIARHRKKKDGKWIKLYYYDALNSRTIAIWHQVDAAWSQKMFLFYMLYSTLLVGWRAANQATVNIMENQYLSIPREGFQNLLPFPFFMENHPFRDSNGGNPFPHVPLPPWVPIYMFV